MDKRYIELFKYIAQATANSAEQVMEYDKKEKAGEGADTAEIMRNNFQELFTRITKAGDDYTLVVADAAKLAIGSIVLVSQLQSQVTELNKAINAYQKDVLPKLKEIVDNAKTDEEAINMANEKFIIKEK